MPAFGPSFSLTDEDRRVLAIRLHEGVSVRAAASALGVNYGHALNFAHAIGYGYQPVTSRKVVNKAVRLVAARGDNNFVPAYLVGSRRDCPSVARGTYPGEVTDSAKDSAVPSPHLAADSTEDKRLRSKATRALIKYGLARLGLFVLLTVIIQLLAVAIGAEVPIVMSALLALLVAFPLSMLIFPKLRLSANQAVAENHRRRQERKQWIADELADR